MDNFVIQSASGAGSLEFFERTPADRARPIERFKVRLTDLELSTVGRVYAITDPTAMFAQMAANWRGWQGEFAWASEECELSLRCTQDRTGHVSIRVELRSGPTQECWAVQSTLMAEAGQLEDLALGAAAFFGGTHGPQLKIRN
jgi:Family of unknown function (DUF6228)